MLLFELDQASITSVKLLLPCFEVMLGLKINFHKCEVVAMGMTTNEGRAIANLLNYKLTAFPISYLGLPTSDKNIRIADWEPLAGKVTKRVEPW